MTTSLADHLASIRERIAASCARSHRELTSVQLVAVSKTKPASLIREAFLAGQTVFGENYAQELRDKADELKELPLEWHFIGHLQRNKVKYVAQAASWMESVDAAPIATELDTQRAKREFTTPIPCLIEVNVGGEASKSGVARSTAPELVRTIQSLPHLDLRGLMILPPYDPDPEQSRPYFVQLRELFEELNSGICRIKPLTELSMGMSHDFEVAIEEGATIVRVGTAIFGGR